MALRTCSTSLRTGRVAVRRATIAAIPCVRVRSDGAGLHGNNCPSRCKTSAKAACIRWNSLIVCARSISSILAAKVAASGPFRRIMIAPVPNARCITVSAAVRSCNTSA